MINFICIAAKAPVVLFLKLNSSNSSLNDNLNNLTINISDDLIEGFFYLTESFLFLFLGKCIN